MEKDDFFKLIQEFLKEPPVIIWGSGATIAYGMPSMSDLLNMLKKRFEFFDDKCTNLEEELGKDSYNQHRPEIRKAIWEYIAKRDEEILDDILKNPQNYNGIISLIDKIIETQPYVCNIITTNYDRVLENVLALKSLVYTDGFTGRFLSSFKEESFRFKQKDSKKSDSFVNLIKVHGSLNWFEIEGKIRYFNNSKSYEPKIIPPGKNKYQQAFSEPYRSLIQISDKTIEKSKSLLVIGFGFNDEHLTPKITERIRENVPIVVVTKEITEETKKQLNKASFYLGIEQASKGKTKISYNKNSERCVDEIDGSFWQLDNFMEALQ